MVGCGEFANRINQNPSHSGCTRRSMPRIPARLQLMGTSLHSIAHPTTGISQGWAKHSVPIKDARCGEYMHSHHFRRSIDAVRSSPAPYRGTMLGCGELANRINQNCSHCPGQGLFLSALFCVGILVNRLSQRSGVVVSGSIEKPDPPASSECCEGGCYPCIWDIYHAQLKQWKEQQEVLKQSLSEQQTSDESQA